MQLIGVPKCPYCRKRVNLIRAWSLKKHGEYRCPRCRGISNIYLSPLIYVLAVVAAASGFLIYFFARFISDTLNLLTAAEIAVPFAVFFLLSVFFVYFEKPVVKRVKRTADGRYFDEEGNELEMRRGKLKPTGRKAEIKSINDDYDDGYYPGSSEFGFDDDAEFDYDSIGDQSDIIPQFDDDSNGKSSEWDLDEEYDNQEYTQPDYDDGEVSEFAPPRDYYENQAETSDSEDFDYKTEEELYAMAAKEYMSSQIDTVDESKPTEEAPIDISSVSPPQETPAKSENPQVLTVRTIKSRSTDEIDRLFADADMKIFGKNDDEIEVGKIARQRNLENTQDIKLPPNSGFEDLFDDYK